MLLHGTRLHSHAIISSERNLSNSKCNAVLLAAKTGSSIGRNLALLISNGISTIRGFLGGSDHRHQWIDSPPGGRRLIDTGQLPTDRHETIRDRRASAGPAFGNGLIFVGRPTPGPPIRFALTASAGQAPFRHGVSGAFRMERIMASMRCLLIDNRISCGCRGKPAT